ncbi:MAG: sialidase family protein, partial [Ignavibacteriaceae bacterium]
MNKNFSFSLILLFILLYASLSFSQYPNILIDGTGSPEEVTIAINPLNPNILAGGANIDNFYRSTNGGNTWIESQLISNLLGVWGDPVVLFDSLGNLYYAHLSNPVSGWWIDRIVVQKSTNDGSTWNDGVGIGQGNQPQAQDKEWLAVDLTQSPYRNNLYVTWTEFDDYGSSNSSDSSRIRFSKSTDQGITWSNAITISDVSGDCIDSDNTDEGAVPCVGPNGEIYVAWAGPLGLVFDKSLDGGNTWGSDVFISDIPGGWDFDVSGIWRCNGLPITMCDISNSPYRGYIYVVWSDQRNGATNTDIFMARSTDGGTTWSSPIKVNDDNTTRHQFFVWSTIDPSTGHLWFVFYDRRNTTGAETDVYVAKSTDGGETFENFKVSDSPFTPSSSVFFGDYTNIAAWNGKIYPIWMRLQSGQLSVWTVEITDTLVVPVELNNFSAEVTDGKVLLSWSTATEINNQGFVIERKSVSSSEESEFVEVGFKAGHGNSTEIHNYIFEDKPMFDGTYHYRLKQMNFDGTFDYSNEI